MFLSGTQQSLYRVLYLSKTYLVKKLLAKGYLLSVFYQTLDKVFDECRKALDKKKYSAKKIEKKIQITAKFILIAAHKHLTKSCIMVILIYRQVYQLVELTRVEVQPIGIDWSYVISNSSH